jgi:hypothetical protein
VSKCIEFSQKPFKNEKGLLKKFKDFWGFLRTFGDFQGLLGISGDFCGKKYVLYNKIKCRCVLQLLQI